MSSICLVRNINRLFIVPTRPSQARAYHYAVFLVAARVVVFAWKLFEMYRKHRDVNITKWFFSLIRSQKEERDFRAFMSQVRGRAWCGPLPFYNCKANGFIALFHMHNCMRMIVAAEQQRGIRYDFVRVHRVNIRFRAPHVQPSLMQVEKADKRCFLHNAAGDLSGYIDIGGLCTRGAARAYLADGVDLLAKNAAVFAQYVKDQDSYIQSARFIDKDASGGFYLINPEYYLKLHLDYNNVTVERLPDISYLICTCTEKRIDERTGICGWAGNVHCMYDKKEQVGVYHHHANRVKDRDV
mmetsp:Transcript_29523/g.47327  ORF Transcript_29523/g.47327 Transcript_29523/m.47327 type:complete len:298 (-) Transcript_29523:338-1231(-)